MFLQCKLLKTFNILQSECMDLPKVVNFYKSIFGELKHDRNNFEGLKEDENFIANK